MFRNNNLFIEGTDGDNVFPQILLTNSHDGKNAFTFTAGLFRLVCENGLVICSKEFENLKIRHYGYDFEELSRVINTMVQSLPLTVESMNRLNRKLFVQNRLLNLLEEQLKFVLVLSNYKTLQLITMH